MKNRIYLGLGFIFISIIFVLILFFRDENIAHSDIQILHFDNFRNSPLDKKVYDQVFNIHQSVLKK